MYDLEGTDTGREWVEVYNSGTTPVDLSSYKFFEANTNHGLTLIAGDKSIPLGGYAIIVSDPEKFKIDWPSFSGSIFDSSFSLDNTGELLAIKDTDSNIVDQYTYESSTGANGDGKSLQKVSNSWVMASPTLGLSNIGSGTTNTNDEALQGGNVDENANSSSTSASSPSPKQVPIKTKITSSTLAFTGTPILFDSVNTGRFGENMQHGKLYWNFGDGDSKTIKLPAAKSFEHAYSYSGEYLVSLEYFENEYATTPSASDKITIKVVPATIIISRVGNSADFFVELKNTTDYDIDLENWSLTSDSNYFVFPKNSILKTEKSVIISPTITKLNFDDEKSLKLVTSSGNIAFDFGATLISVNKNESVIKKSEIISTTTVAQANSNNLRNIQQIFQTDLTIDEAKEAIGDLPTQNLEADVIGSVNSSSTVDKSYFSYPIFALLLGVSVIAVNFVRGRKKAQPQEGDDFEILED